MWPFRKDSTRQPWIEEALQRTHMVALELERRLSSLEHSVGQLAEGILTARTHEKRVAGIELALRNLGAAQAEDVQRLQASLDQVRGWATGARGGRPRNEEREADREAMELGRKVIQAMSTPEGRAQLVLELQGRQADPVGGGSWNPRANGTGKPV